MSAIGGKADMALASQNVTYDPKRICRGCSGAVITRRLAVSAGLGCLSHAIGPTS